MRRDHLLEELERLVVRAGALVEDSEAVLADVALRRLLRGTEVGLLGVGQLLLPLVQRAQLEVAA